MMKQELNIRATEPSAPKADVVRPDVLSKEIARRRMLGRIWIVISLVWWLGTTIPIIYVVSSAGPCASRVLPQWLTSEC